jgi:hypothetical protein
MTLHENASYLRIMRVPSALVLVAAGLLFSGCAVDRDDGTGDGDAGDDLDPATAEQALDADPLNVVPMDTDVASGTVEGRIARVLTDSASSRALLGGGMPSVRFSRNWLVAYRPADKTPTSRVQVTRAQLSATGKTLSLWATITEPGAGCAAWWPNELAVVRVPSRTTKPESIRVYVTRANYACGLVQGAACNGGLGGCSAPTPFCHGSLYFEDDSTTQGVCTKYPAYDGSSEACENDAACGAGGICAGLSFGQGLCQPAWMRGTFSVPASGQLSAPLPQGGAWHRVPVRVTGLSSVPMDAWVQVFADGIPPSRVEWRLANHYGTTSTTIRGTSFGAHVPVGVPGDEAVNADWTLEVRDVGAGAPGNFRGARVSFTSRWD